MTLKIPTHCWYIPGACNIQDVIRLDDGLSYYGKRTADQILAEHPTALKLTIDDALARIKIAARAKYNAGVITPIDEATFTDALECLPPSDWRTVRGVESFKMMECLHDNLTHIYAHQRTATGSRYVSLVEDINTPADIIADKVIAHFAGTKAS
jgi:hypothetical protein